MADHADAELVKDFLLRITPRTPETLADALKAVNRLAAGVPVADDETRREVEALIAAQTPHVCVYCKGVGWLAGSVCFAVGTLIVLWRQR